MDAIVFDMKGTLHPKTDLVDTTEKSYAGNATVIPQLFPPLSEEVLSLLSEMKDRIHIATGGKLPWRIDVAKHLGLLNIISEDRIHYLKNKDDADWQKLIQKLGVSPSEIYVVGDLLEYDITPPKKLGCKTVWINPIKQSNETETNYQVVSLPDAVCLIKSLTLKWNFKKRKEYDLIIDETVNKLIDIFNDGMGQSEWKPNKVKRQLKSSHVLGLLEDEQGKSYSYFFATIPRRKLNEKNLLWIDACSVRMKYQKFGLFAKAIEQLKTSYPKYNFGFAGGRSQNPIVFKIIDKLSDKAFYPFDKLYSIEQIEFLKETIKNEVGRPSNNKDQHLNQENGILTNAYWHRRLGNYPVDLNNEIVLRYEKKLSSWNFDRCNGDAVVLLKEL